MDSLQLFQTNTAWHKHPKWIPKSTVSVAFWDLMCPTRTTVDLRRRPSAAGRTRKPVIPSVQHLWHEEGHFIQLQSEGATSKPSLRGFIPSCLGHTGKLKSSMWLLCVNKDASAEKKNPCLFVAYFAWENTCCLQRDLTVCWFLKHICKSLKLEVLLTLEEKADSKQKLRKKKICCSICICFSFTDK